MFLFYLHRVKPSPYTLVLFQVYHFQQLAFERVESHLFGLVLPNFHLILDHEIQIEYFHQKQQNILLIYLVDIGAYFQAHWVDYLRNTLSWLINHQCQKQCFYSIQTVKIFYFRLNRSDKICFEK